MKRALLLLCALALPALFTGCAAMQKVTEAGTAVAVGAGVMTEDQAGSVNKSTAAIVKAAEVLTPENEYYIGRAVGASVLASYKPLNAPAPTDYVNTLGQALAMVSDMPQTFGGYHFLILDSDEVNAFAAPGGLIFVSRGMLRCAKNETALAAVLAHEIGHVQFKHGLQSIKKGRITQASVTVLAESGKQLGGENLRMLSDQFSGTVDDIMKTLVVNGYSRGAEKEADQAAVTILKRLGYNPAGLLSMLREMESQVHEGGPGFGKTHPPPRDRIALVEKALGGVQPIAENAVMQNRFAAAMKGL